ncbi:MAG: MarR family winged helix-turn-helix transcriptional regulator [Thermoanaerobaculia bacterium]|jgi:DNA-binding MarR family transcriptional regulator
MKKTTEIARFREIAQLLYRRLGVLQRDEICCAGVTVPQCYAMQILRAEGELAQGDLAGRLGIDPSSATRAVDILERNGHVERARTGDGDRRKVMLRLTPSGEVLTDQLMKTGDDLFAGVLSKFTPGERRDLARLLGKLADAFGGGSDCCAVPDAGEQPTARAAQSRRKS